MQMVRGRCTRRKKELCIQIIKKRFYLLIKMQARFQIAQPAPQRTGISEIFLLTKIPLHGGHLRKGVTQRKAYVIDIMQEDRGQIRCVSICRVAFSGTVRMPGWAPCPWTTRFRTGTGASSPAIKMAYGVNFP